jgi:4-alpha-glucanotransferase
MATGGACVTEDPEMDEVAAMAQLWGVEAEYFDVFGRRHVASAETLKRLVEAISAGRGGPAQFETCAPQRAFQGDGRRLWGIAVQLYSLRSRRNWGHGDFTDLARLAALAALRGAAVIGLNPLHALFVDRAEAASPYAPNSRLFLNPLYIDVEAIPEFPGTGQAGLDEDIAALRASELIDYAGLARVKLAALRLAHQQFRATASAERRAGFETYRREQGDALLGFTCFECLRARHPGQPWPEWPAPWRRPPRDQLLAFRQAHDKDCEFQEFVQWTADRQLAACRDAARNQGMPIGLYIDLAVGIDPRGADAWMHQDIVLPDVSVGAPPDEFNPAGQNWGLAPFNPQALAANGCAAMRVLMRAVMRHAGAIRLDHVLGLERLFMIPHGGDGGGYVRFPLQQLARVISEESHRCGCVVIGEDLGTVPDHFRETMAQWGFWACRVMLFEREYDGRFRAPENYAAEALATFNTHDMASFRGWLEGHDMRIKRGIGFDPGESDEARAHARAALRDALARWAPQFPPDDVAAVAAFLALTPCRMAVIALDDILGVLDQINVPGSVAQHPNWRRKLPVAIEDLPGNGGLARVAQAFAQAGRGFKA